MTVAPARGQSVISTLSDLLIERACEHASMKVYRWLANGSKEEASLTFAELDQRARQIAGRITPYAKAGDRALLLYGPGLAFIEALFGCFYAGVIAVPAYVPGSRREYPRIETLMRNASCAVALSTENHLDAVSSFITSCGVNVKCLATDLTAHRLSEEMAPATPVGEVAYLQYTSGSTSDPKGVMVTHSGVLANLESIAAHGGFDKNTVSVNWLPHFHDMGLIYGILQPIYSCFPAVLLSPSSFIHKPFKWLNAISHYRGTHAGGPNFAYDLCVERIGAAELSSLNLSTWKVAFNGSEPIRPETLDRFADRFAGCGFSSKAFYPVYGLAEASLKATSSEPWSGAKTCRVDTGKLVQNHAEIVSNNMEPSSRLVSCGGPSRHHEIAIVDTDALTSRGEKEVGEIWVAGPSIAAGYWNNSEATKSTFQAYLNNGKGPYLRTGDLGFVHDGELFITGRLKDCIIVRGRNYYPQDFEQTVENSHAALRRNGCAAFSLTNSGLESVIVVAEVERKKQADLSQILDAIRQAVGEAHEIRLFSVVLIPSGALPKTSSGKVQRNACKQKFVQGELPTLAESTLADDSLSPEPLPLARETLLAKDLSARVTFLEGYLIQLVAYTVKQPLDATARSRTLVSLGIDSLMAFNLLAKIEAETGITFSLGDLLDQNIAQIASFISIRLETRDETDANEVEDAQIALRPRQKGSLVPLAPSQEQVWILQQLYPESRAYNEHCVVRLEGDINVHALGMAINEVVQRHEILRTTFISVDGVPYQSLQLFKPVELPRIELPQDSGSLQELESLVRRETASPFQLEQNPPIRFLLAKYGVDEWFLLILAHHIVCDGSSLNVVLQELGTLYTAFQEENESPLPALEIQYSDYALWQKERLQGALLDRSLDYWRKQLADLPILDLPADRLHPAVPTHRGSLVQVSLPANLQHSIKTFARNEGITLFTILLTAFQVLLGKYTGQSDVAVGTALAGRSHRGIQNLIGFFVNTLPLRARLDWNMSSVEVLAQARKIVFDACEHQEVPFKKLVEEIPLQRDAGRSPLFQVLLAVQPHLAETPQFGSLRLSFPEIHAGTSKFDLTLNAVETESGLRTAIEYNQDIYEASTVQRMAEHFRILLEQMVAQPAQRIGDLALLSKAERQRLEDWNCTEAAFPNVSIHELFARQADLTPDASALVDESSELSYKELNCRANQLARYLMKWGVGPETRVGVCMDRNPDMVVALLAVLKSGGAYLPLDPQYPRERLEFMLADAQVQILLTQSSLSDLLPHDFSGAKIYVDTLGTEISSESGANPETKINPGNLAYVIYTSGSTGRPKGVAIVHGSASVMVQWAQRAFSAEELRGVLASTSICFDLSVFEIFVPLSVGGAVVLASNALALPQWLASDRITLVNTVPSAMAELLRVNGIPSSVQVVNLAGEALHRSLVEQIYGAAKVKSVFNLYGPSEDTTYSSFIPLKRGALPVTIGRPIANTQAYVLDSQGQPMPTGVAGELYLGGAGLARGYLNRPEQTAEKFVPNPFSIKQGERLYRTGDRVRWTHDGELDFLGRLDHQIKLRGFRIELGEIEAALLQHESVDRSLAMVRENSSGEKQLVAYIVGADAGGRSSAAVLRDYLRTRLPEYMVPAVFVEMQDFPLTPNGKVDRKALPEPNPEALDKRGQQSLSRPEEEILSNIFAAVLKRDAVYPDQDFFALGGHSLVATQVISRVREAFGTDLPLRSIFEARTSRQLTELIRQSRSSRKIYSPPLTPLTFAKNVPLSYAQQRIWFLDQMNPGEAVYNMPFEMRLSGRLDKDALDRSVNKIVERHEALRTRFQLEEGTPVQLVTSELRIAVDQDDLRALPLSQRESAAQQLAEQEALRAFDLANGPLLRVKLIQLADEEYLLLVNMHHIVSDGWSVGVMVREFEQLYTAYAEGHDAILPALKIQYRDYAIWQRERLQGQIIEEQLAYWKEQLANLTSLELPSRKLPSAERSGIAASERVTISSETIDRLRAMCRREGVTPFMALLAAFAVALSDFSGQKDIAIGSPVANREHTETEGMIGLFLNTLVLRNDLAGNPTFRTLLQRTREMVFDAHENQDIPFEKLVEELAQNRNTGKTLLFQAMISMQNTEHNELKLPGLRLSGFSSRTPLAKFDLLLLLSEKETGIECDLSYTAQIYEASMMGLLMAHWLRVLNKMIDATEVSIDDLPLLSEAEFQLVLGWNPKETSYPRKCIHELFLEQAKRTPSAMAVKHKGEALTYSELNRRANQLGHYLAKMGVGPETRVAICLERGLEMVIGLLAILKAGAAYVPLDPTYPVERLQMMLEDVQARVLVTQNKLVDRFQRHGIAQVLVDGDRAAIDEESSSEIKTAVSAGNLAYLIYTSGSTGKPKAVAIQHGSAAALLDWGAKIFSPAELAGTLASTSICFDLSVFEIFQPLVCGGTVIMVSNVLELAETDDQGEITLINTVPSAMRELIRMKAVPESVRVVNLAGEELQRALVDQIYELKHVERVLNLYGPSEDTTYSTFASVPSDEQEAVTIGRAITNSQAYVLDQAMRPVPVGVIGELWLGGEGLARGYLHRPEITAERFLPNPFAGAHGQRLYRTGDQACWRADGMLEFLGRLDHQVKLRGHRIELGEIEAALMKHGAVEQAVVMARGDEADKKLVAYLVKKNGHAAVEVEMLREHLRGIVPEYMLPAAYVFLEEFPLTRNGKVDRKALPEPEFVAKEYVAPSTITEETLAEIWSEVLKVKRPGIRDNFFEAGGHSLLAIQLIARVREVLHVDLPVRQLFERPTIETMSQYISQLELSHDNVPELVPISREAFRI